MSAMQNKTEVIASVMIISTFNKKAFTFFAEKIPNNASPEIATGVNAKNVNLSIPSLIYKIESELFAIMLDIKRMITATILMIIK